MAEDSIISVIVPVYNAERYLRECVESILAQSYTAYELILVDDGSTDSSASICDEYSSKDERVVTLHGENKGVSAARKRGYNESSGKYICFVDADDTISMHYLNWCKESLDNKDVDIICLGLNDDIFSGDEYARRLLKNQLPWFLHHKCFKRDVFQGDVLNVPSKFFIGEDLIVNIRLSQYVRKVKCISYQGYNYRVHENSITHVCRVDLKYEEDFIEEVSRSLSPILCSCYDELWLFKLQYIRRMIQARNGIKRGSEWVQETLNYRGNVRIGFSERIVLLVPDFKLCYIILMLKEWIVKAMRCLSIQSF